MFWIFFSFLLHKDLVDCCLALCLVYSRQDGDGNRVLRFFVNMVGKD